MVVLEALKVFEMCIRDSQKAFNMKKKEIVKGC